MKLIVALFRRSPGMAVLAGIAGILSGSTSTALLVWLNQLLFSGETGPSTAALGGFLGLCVVAPLTSLVSFYSLQRLGQGEMAGLRLELSRQILGTSVRELEQLGAPRLLSVLTEDVLAISNSIMLIPQIIINAAISCGCLGYLAWLSPTLFWVLIGVFVLGILSYQLPTARAMAMYHRARRREEVIFRYFRGLVEGIKELVINQRRSAAFLESFDAKLTDQKNMRLKANTMAGAATAWGQFLIFAVIGALLGVGTLLHGVEHDQLVRYVVILVYIGAPIQICLNSLPPLGRAGAAVKRIDELGFSLQAADTPRQAPSLSIPAGSWNELRFDGVAYTYHEQGRNGEEGYEFHLGPLDLRIRRGELLFLTGGNGSGKTSLAKLLLGLYVPEGGRILVDDCEVTDENRDVYRNRFSAVFSDFFLFEELFGIQRDGIDETAARYLEKLDLRHKVRVEDGVLSTTELSQGQRKRLALLVAYLEDRDIFLFDEWAADQDPVFKRVFYEVLLPELKQRGKTIFVISHDEHFYGVADRIIKLDMGQIESDRSRET